MTSKIYASPRSREFTSAGAVLNGGKLYFYAAGTTTPAATYTSAAMTVAHPHPVVATTAGLFPAIWLSATTSYDITLKNAAGSTIWTVSSYSDALTADEVGRSSYPISAGETAAGLTDNDLTHQYVYGDVRRYGAVGDGSTDDTTALRNCYLANQGKRVDHGDSLDFKITAQLTLYTGTRYVGRSRIFQGSAAAIVGPMCLATAQTGVVWDGPEIDGNAAGNAATLTYGIKFTGGSNNLVTDNSYIHDTTQAGVWVDDEDNTWSHARVHDCGRNLGTDNHGVMFTATAGNLNNCGVSGRIKGAYRKGVALYAATPGAITNFTFDGPVVSGCGLVGSSGGGIYVSNAALTTDSKSVVMNGCISYNNYVNYEIDTSYGVRGEGNFSGTTGGDAGGAAGVVCNNCTDVVLGMTIREAAAGGLVIDSGERVYFPNVFVDSCNTDGNAFAPAIVLNDCIGCGVPGAFVSDAAANITHCIYEDGTTDYSNLDGVVLSGVASAANIAVIAGANTLYRRILGRNHGYGITTPLNTIHVSGGISFVEQAITLANGANHNVTLPTNAGHITSSAPTGVYSITGIAGGHAGRRITLVNYTVYTLTLTHESASSTAANRIIGTGAADVSVPQLSAVELVYSAVSARWHVLR